jgi:hypothetical protein
VTEPIRAQILVRSGLPTMAEALSAVLAEETRLRTIYAAPLVPQHSVLVAPPQYVVMDSSLVSKEKPKEKPKKHCGGKTRTEERCFQKYPHLLKELRPSVQHLIRALQQLFLRSVLHRCLQILLQ